MQLPITNKTFLDLINNAQPEKIATFDDKGEFKGIRQAAASLLSIDLNDPIISDSEQRLLTPTELSSLRGMTTSNSQAIASASTPNKSTWKHMITGSGVLARAGVAFDTSGNFEGFPFFCGFDDVIGTTWLGEGATLPENSAPTTRFPYEVHTVGAFTLVSRRLNKLVPQLLAQVKIAQANAIKAAVEKALIQGSSLVDANQPDGLIRQITKNVLSGASKTGVTLLADALAVLENNGLDRSEVKVLMAPDVAKKLRLESTTVTHKGLELTSDQLLISKFMPAGSMLTGRFSDFQVVTGKSVEFLAHTYTPKDQPETGATRVRSLFDVDAVVLNQDSFVKTTAIN